MSGYWVLYYSALVFVVLLSGSLLVLGLFFIGGFVVVVQLILLERLTAPTRTTSGIC